MFSECFGYLDPETQLQTTNRQTRFDLASVSKLFTVAALMTCVEEGRVALDQRVGEFLPEFSGARPIAPYPDPLHPGGFVQVVDADNERVDAGAVTFRHLLAHNSGLPAWLPLWKLPTQDALRVRAATLQTNFAYPTGTRVVYSDIGLIVLGWALEKICAASLRDSVHARVTAPLGLASISFGPIDADNAAPTEFYAHQGRRMCGEVHDENAFALGGDAFRECLAAVMALFPPRPTLGGNKVTSAQWRAWCCATKEAFVEFFRDHETYHCLENEALAAIKRRGGSAGPAPRPSRS